MALSTLKISLTFSLFYETGVANKLAKNLLLEQKHGLTFRHRNKSSEKVSATEIYFYEQLKSN